MVDTKIKSSTGSFERGPHSRFAEAVEEHRAGRLERAIELYHNLVLQFPEHAPAWNNLGVALRAINKIPAAVSILKRGVALNPKDAGAWSNLGNALRALGKYEDAVQAHKVSLGLRPDDGQVYYNLALVWRDLGQPELALESISKAERLGFKSTEMNWDRALTHLMLGDLSRGFREYESRWKLPESPPRFTDIQPWDGKPYKGKTLLIHSEQGFGDIIQFLRYLPIALSLGGRLVYECPLPLLRLVRYSSRFANVEFVAQSSRKINADFQLSLLSLPRVFGTTLNTIPCDGPYLSPPGDGPKINIASNGLRVGLLWAGKSTHKNNRKRSIPLINFLPLLELPKIRFIGLQKGDGSDEPKNLGVDALVINIGEQLRDFADTAAVLKQLDLLISVDTSVVHLAGAIGLPTWVLIPFAPDWRWLFGRDDTPWYKSVRLFRQETPESWSEVIWRIRNEVEAIQSKNL